MAALTLAFCVLFLVNSSLQDFPFRNTSLSWDERVDDLVGRLTLDEIQLQMAKGGVGINGPTPAIDRLGIKTYQWDTECLHGDAWHNATGFPQSIGLAASFSTDLIFRMAEATAVEVRATHHATNTGLSCFAPVINIMRDPRWGRNQETYGEDPILNGMLAQAYIKGLQGDHPRYVRASGGCKHFNVHGGPDNVPVSRFSFDSQVSIRDWRTTFLPAFRYCVEAGTYSLMCSYNRINGVPACANEFLLTEVLRKEWGFKGYVVSDEEALENIIFQHKYVNNTVDAATACVKAGCNLELSGKSENHEVFMSISDAVSQGKLTEDLVRERVKPLFYTRMRLGEFDPPEMNPYASITTDVIEEKSHRDLAVEASMKSFVLLKNDGFLPLLQSTINKIAVVGPFGDNAGILNGDYDAAPDRQFITTPRQGLSSLASTTNFAQGCDDAKCKSYDSDSVKSAVDGVDVVFICLGLGTLIEKEANDRYDMELPAGQVQLMKDAVANSGSAKIVLITFNAGPVNITWADSNPRVSAIIAAFYPGQATGVALYNVLLGQSNSQFGRLPYTWYYSADQVPPITNYTMVNRTYRYMTSQPLYPFGYGLTYSSFYFDELTSTTSINAGDDQNISVHFQNRGSRTADEIVQVYLGWKSPSVPTPNIQLVNFTRVTVPQGRGVNLNFTITPQNMAVYIEDQGWVVEEGILMLSVGGQQPFAQRTGNTNYISTEFNVVGSKILTLNKRLFVMYKQCIYSTMHFIYEMNGILHPNVLH